jgi:hypothetical protein
MAVIIPYAVAMSKRKKHRQQSYGDNQKKKEKESTEGLVRILSSSTMRGMDGHKAEGTNEKERPMTTMPKKGVKYDRPNSKCAGRMARPPKTTK